MNTFDSILKGTEPILALAPMQDVTDLPFWRLMARYGGAEVYYTEYFRVHPTSNLEKWILESIIKNPTGKPVVAQMIGNDIPSLVRTVRQLQQYPVAAIDLNLGCPAPVVYRKCAGGGLLREPQKVDTILGALREAVSIKFTVKTRLGFDSPEVFDKLLPIFAKHRVDLLTVHGRTVKEMYRSEVHYDFIARAVATLPFPVLANGNIYSAAKADEVLRAAARVVAPDTAAPASASVAFSATAASPNRSWFVQQDLRAKYRHNLLSPAQPPILQSFEVARTGDKIQLFDSDGSVYEGEVLGVAAAKSVPDETKQKIEQSADFAFHVAGTNQQINRFVTFSGYFAVTNVNDALAKTADDFQSGALSQRSRVAGNGLINGRVSVGGTNQFEIQATEVAK